MGWYGSLFNNGSQRDGRSDAGDSGTVYRAENRHIKPRASMLRVAGCFVLFSYCLRTFVLRANPWTCRRHVSLAGEPGSKQRKAHEPLGMRLRLGFIEPKAASHCSLSAAACVIPASRSFTDRRSPLCPPAYEIDYPHGLDPEPTSSAAARNRSVAWQPAVETRR